MIKTTYKLFKNIGFDFYIFLLSIKGIPAFIKDWINFAKHNTDSKNFGIKSLMPMLADRYDKAGVAKGHYFHQDLLIAQKVFEANPLKHVDVGSRIDGFVAHVASYREVEIFDIRELKINLKNVTFKQLDMMEESNSYSDYCDSISCLHAIEHFGLGRYGDPIDSEGHLKGFNSLHRILKPNGTLYFSTPIGNQQVVFNAHRIFSVNYLLKMFENKFQVVSFNYVDDSGDLHLEVNHESDFATVNFNLKYGCGIFELKKI
jgi:hypothetical protein